MNPKVEKARICENRRLEGIIRNLNHLYNKELTLLRTSLTPYDFHQHTRFHRMIKELEGSHRVVEEGYETYQERSSRRSRSKSGQVTSED